MHRRHADLNKQLKTLLIEFQDLLPICLYSLCYCALPAMNSIIYYTWWAEFFVKKYPY